MTDKNASNQSGGSWKMTGGQSGGSIAPLHGTIANAESLHAALEALHSEGHAFWVAVDGSITDSHPNPAPLRHDLERTGEHAVIVVPTCYTCGAYAPPADAPYTAATGVCRSCAAAKATDG